MTGSDSSSSKKANLARIRDNQRRSRARRKEYLQELEAKWRICEQLGVEASAEMQAAARKVLEENKRLRTLLKRKGVSDEEIDAFATNSSVATSPPSAPGSPAPADYPSPAPSTQLAKMLVTRKPIMMSRPNRAPTVVKQQIPDADALAPQVLPQTSQPTIKQQPPPQLTPIIPFTNLSPSPQTIVSSTVSTPTTILSPEIFSATPSTTASDPGEYALPPAYHFNPNLDTSWQPYQSPVSATSFPDFAYTSCVDAANIIRSMRTDGSVDFESDLGCTNLGTECKVDNIASYNMIMTSQPVPVTVGQPASWR